MTDKDKIDIEYDEAVNDAIEAVLDYAQSLEERIAVLETVVEQIMPTVS